MLTDDADVGGSAAHSPYDHDCPQAASGFQQGADCDSSGLRDWVANYSYLQESAAQDHCHFRVKAHCLNHLEVFQLGTLLMIYSNKDVYFKRGLFEERAQLPQSLDM